MYFVKRRGVYVRAFPARGLRLRALPIAAVRIVVRGVPYQYADGVFYMEKQGEYEVAALRLVP